MEERIKYFIETKDKLSVISEDCMHGLDRSKEKRIFEGRLDGAIKAISEEKLAEEIRDDLHFCFHFKTVGPMLWMCSLDAKELPKGTTFETEYSSDVRIGIGADDKGLHLSVKTKEKGEILSDYFSLNDAERVFNDVLEAAEAAKREIEGEELTDEDHDDHDEL